MNPLKLEKHYRSPIDEFLTKLNETLPPSESQSREIKEAERIAFLRDTCTARTDQEK